MSLKAYEVGSLIVFAENGVMAKSFAAPLIRPNSEWVNAVTDWVALMANRRSDLDGHLDTTQTEPYIYQA